MYGYLFVRACDSLSLCRSLSVYVEENRRYAGCKMGIARGGRRKKEEGTDLKKGDQWGRNRDKDAAEDRSEKG